MPQLESHTDLQTQAGIKASVTYGCTVTAKHLGSLFENRTLFYRNSPLPSLLTAHLLHPHPSPGYCPLLIGSFHWNMHRLPALGRAVVLCLKPVCDFENET